MYLLPVLLPIFIVSLTSLIINFFPKNIIIYLIFFGLCTALFITCFIFYEVLLLNNLTIVEICNWIDLGNFNIKFSFFFDKLTILMLLLILIISLLVHFFAYDYLREDPHIIRFLILLFIFTIFMEVLVTAGTTIQLFLGWEGVGLMSYLLINFWFTRYYAINSGLMAIIYNRIGDVGLLLAIGLIFVFVRSSDFMSLILLTKISCLMQLKFTYIYVNLLDMISALLFLGTIGKSAQIFLESWLSQAMEGPTPVSSLLHASTMIVSGVFLLQRFQFYVIHSLLGMSIIVFVGGLTAFFAGTIVL